MIEHRPLINADGLVVSVVLYDTEAKWDAPANHTLGPEGGCTGDTWDGEKYIPAPMIEKPPDKVGAEPAATSRLPELIGIATYAMNIGRGDAGNYRWHHRNATEDFEIDGQRMDAQTFMDWAEDQSQI